MSELPHVYRLLSVFSGIPLGTFEALRRSGLWEDAGPVCDSHRALLRLLTTDGRIRWVTWGPDGEPRPANIAEACERGLLTDEAWCEAFAAAQPKSGRAA